MTPPSLLVTRPQASATRFVAGLSLDIQKAVTIVISPLLEIIPTGATPDLLPYAGVIFTSSNAVDLAPEGNQRPAFCVGQRTAARAKAAGWVIRAEEQTADDLIARLDETAPTGPLLHLAGKHRRGDIAALLSAQGTATDVHILYDQITVGLTRRAHDLLRQESRVVVPLFSPRSASQFINQVPELHNVTIVAMSNAVAQCCRGFGAACIMVVAEPTAQEMLRDVEKLLRRTSLA